MFQLPQKVNLGTEHCTCISFILYQYNEHKELLEQGKHLLTATAERYACGFPIPSFQRTHVWTQDQQIKFIESVWKGVPLGSFMFHRMDWHTSETHNQVVPAKFSGWLIDGQQRLTALEAYWNDEFPVFGGLWSEISRRDKREFSGFKFSHNEVVFETEEEIKELYLLMAFGGTAHTEADREHALNSQPEDQSCLA